MRRFTPTLVLATAVVCAAIGALIGGCQARGSNPEHPVYTECWPEAPNGR